MSREIVLDLHTHSRFSRAVSLHMNLSTMYLWARIKGIHVLSVSDFTHPLWFREISRMLEEVNEGVYTYSGSNEVRTEYLKYFDKPFVGPYFLLSTEISCIYSEYGRPRRVHVIVFAPNLTTVAKINTTLKTHGFNLTADGRPILGISLKNLCELLFGIDPTIAVIPAHAWTPWFGVYGSKSGYDSLQEAFGEYSKYIFAIESGLSSDPLMNWNIRELKTRSVVSFSDAHSLSKLGREVTVLKKLNNKDITESDVTYAHIKNGLVRGNEHVFKLAYTVEFYPEEGKYHFTGHRKCNVVYSLEQTHDRGTVCPVCGRELTVGVLQRIDVLAAEEQSPHHETDSNGVVWVKDSNNVRAPFVNLVPLLEVIAESVEVGVGSKKVMRLYEQMIEAFGSELEILLRTDLSPIKKIMGPKIAEGIEKVRARDIDISPGFDGEYGSVSIWNKGSVSSQKHTQLEMI